VEKGTLDAFCCHPTKDGKREGVQRYLAYLGRSIAPGGRALIVSFGPPETRLCWLKRKGKEERRGGGMKERYKEWLRREKGDEEAGKEEEAHAAEREEEEQPWWFEDDVGVESLRAADKTVYIYTLVRNAQPFAEPLTETGSAPAEQEQGLIEVRPISAEQRAAGQEQHCLLDPLDASAKEVLARGWRHNEGVPLCGRSGLLSERGRRKGSLCLCDRGGRAMSGSRRVLLRQTQAR
jgi:hypothetical protein